MEDVTLSFPQPIAVIDGWPINIANLDSAVREVVQAAKRNQGFSVLTLNLDHLDKLRRLPRFRDAYARASFVTADGAPVAVLASWQGGQVERATGADLVVPLAQAAALEGQPVYLYGSSLEILARAKAELAQRTGSGLLISGMDSPPQGFDPEGPVADAALDRIAESGAKLCFVALGAPKQEIFAARAMERGLKVGFICIGAGLDFIAGSQKRAPRVMQRYGLEWFWRFSTDPRRLGVRYARCMLVLAKIIFGTLVRQRT